MADLETRLIATERLLERTRQKHKKELDRLHREIKRLKARKTPEPDQTGCPVCTSMLDGRGT